MRIQMLETNHPELSIRQQASILSLNRSSIYYKAVFNEDILIGNLIKDVYLDSDCRYGYRKITKALQFQGHEVNHKKVLRLMKDMKIQGLYPKKFKNTSLKTNHALYPYLLEGLIMKRPNQVWTTDITYISLNNFLCIL